MSSAYLSLVLYLGACTLNPRKKSFMQVSNIDPCQLTWPSQVATTVLVPNATTQPQFKIWYWNMRSMPPPNERILLKQSIGSNKKNSIKQHSISTYICLSFINHRTQGHISKERTKKWICMICMLIIHSSRTER